ncbi:hypothetical protein TNCV_32341 [Trichonephila clavipes]|nr:hypothetical protein TNCV_32341 [Trichonephila clavipes]
MRFVTSPIDILNSLKEEAVDYSKKDLEYFTGGGGAERIEHVNPFIQFEHGSTKEEQKIYFTMNGEYCTGKRIE